MTPTNQTDAQMKLADVTQADRDLWKYLLDAPKSQCTMMDTCDPATDELQAIARHRLATEARAQGLVEAERERCARIVERRAEARFAENGTREWDTNATYYQGGMAEIYEALDEEADEIAAAIRNQHSQHGGDGKGEIECTLWKK